MPYSIFSQYAYVANDLYECKVLHLDKYENMPCWIEPLYFLNWLPYTDIYPRFHKQQ
jgi:hypothetical protein